MRNLGLLLLLLLLLLLPACLGSDDAEPVEQADLGTAEPECLIDPCKDEPAPTLPLFVGEVTVTSKVDRLQVVLQEETPSLSFELVGPSQLNVGEKTRVRVTLTGCPPDDKFTITTESLLLPQQDGEGPLTQTHVIKFKPRSADPLPPIEARTIDVSATDVERVSGVDSGFFDGYPAAGNAPLLLVAARNAVVIVNLTTDEEVETLPTPSGATYGTAPFANATGRAFVANGAWGAAVWQYVAGSFVMLGGAPFVTGNITDVAVCPGGRIVVANHTAGKIQFYDLNAGKYEINSGLTIDLEGVVSVEKLPNGEYLANTESANGDGTAWFIPADSLPRMIGPRGKFPRMITASPQGDFAVMPTLGDGISFPTVFFLSSTSGSWEFKQGLSGIRAVSCAVEERADGNLTIAMPSSRDDEIRHVVMEPDATVVDQSTEASAGDCVEPTHAEIFARGLYVTCVGTSTIEVKPVPE